MGPGIGGATDLLIGVRQVIVATEHVTREGKPKLVADCSMPLTADRRVDLIVTDLGVFVPAGSDFRLLELAPGVTLEQVQGATGAPVFAGGEIPEMEVGSLAAGSV